MSVVAKTITNNRSNYFWFQSSIVRETMSKCELQNSFEIFDRFCFYKNRYFRYPDALPSFKRAANSFHSIATKAEDTMKEVNEWLSGKQRKLY